jgi:lipopolysaccharide export system protein LptA
MNNTSHLLFFVLNMALCGAAVAEKADTGKPVNFEAEQMAVDDVKQVRTLTGKVIVTRGSMILRADKMILTVTPEGYQSAVLFADAGKLATFRQKRDGGADLWMDGHAERIEYDEKSELVKLISKAQMRRLDGNKPTDNVEAEFISYDSRAEYLSVNNTAKGESKPGAGRIKGSFQTTPDIKAP